MKITTQSFAILAASGALVIGTAAFAQDSAMKSDHSMKSGKMSADSHFVSEAASGGMEEVELGKLATQKASSEKVKQFGQRMVDDHTKANDQLKQVASQENFMVPSEMMPKDKMMVDKMSALSGAAFDKAYVKAMLIDHKKDVASFQKESTSGQDAGVKNFATQTLPTLQEHLKMVQDLNASM